MTDRQTDPQDRDDPRVASALRSTLATMSTYPSPTRLEAALPELRHRIEGRRAASSAGSPWQRSS
ncbi:MAG: hypothetical protein FWF90_17285 [Promicromonosporaceae bacterium]|nr:hypothetical protein [Promicromonosporaceae bacterium]